MSTFSVTVDHAKIDKQVKEAVLARIESEQASIISNTIRVLFEAPNHFNKKGGVIRQLLAEKIETISLDAVAAIDDTKVRADFDKLFAQYYAEHLPVAVERAARKAAYQKADQLASAKK